MEARCGVCHGAEGGVLPQFNETTVPYLIDAMNAAISSGRMPPWVPGPLGVPLADVREVLPEERQLLASWAAGPRVMGDAADYVPRTRRGLVPNRPADVELLMPKAYLADRTKQDSDRCFLLPPFQGQIVAYQWIADAANPKHHMAAEVVDATGLAVAQKLDPDGNGWDCAGGWGIPALNLLGAVGVGPAGGQTYPEGTAVNVPAGLVLQVHSLPRQARGAGRDGIRLWTTNAPTVHIRTLGMSAPAELPCPDPAAPNCSRAEALKDPGEKAENDSFLSQCGYASIEDYYARTVDRALSPEHLYVHSACNSPIGGAVRLVGMHIHAHTRATSARLSVQHNGVWSILLDLPKWRWVWEGSYTPLNEVKLEAGDTLKLECSFDNGTLNQWSANGEPGHDAPAQAPLLPPVYVKSGSARSDEMCALFGDIAP